MRGPRSLTPARAQNNGEYAQKFWTSRKTAGFFIGVRCRPGERPIAPYGRGQRGCVRCTPVYEALSSMFSVLGFVSIDEVPMPRRPPTHRPLGYRPAPPSKPTIARVRGRALQKRRERMLRHNPLCVICLVDEVYREAVEVDHIVPLWEGGIDNECNLQCLCREHHAEKTARERYRRDQGRAST